jgi:hypothetical protein
MPWWLLLLFVFLVWCLWAVAATMQVAVKDARHPLPDGKRRGMSAAPVIPIFPLALWGAATLLDVFIDPWGTVIIGSLHALYAVILVGSILRDWRQLQSRDER